jgi:isoleucyl-tRNA synthetase
VVVGDNDPHGDAYIIESRRQGPVVEATGLKAPNILVRIPAKSLENIKVRHPFLDRAIVPVMANYVTAEDGTGIVHTAPGHGREDNLTGVQYGIDIYCPVDESGKIFEGLPEYVGKRVFDANSPIIELLKARKVLMGPRGGAVVH